jgi:prophage DNA circulation protein
MSWRDRYRQASFRGVEFYVRSIESGFGRAHAIHEFPLVDKPSTEDLGRKPDEFSVEAYLLGDNYDRQRDRLIKACRDTPGAGELVHPYQGSQSVVCKGIRVRESSADGGMCVITMTFIEAGEPIVPAVANDGKRAVRKAAKDTGDAAEAAFADGFSILGMAGFVVDAATAQMQALTSALNVNGITKSLEAVTEFAYSVRTLNAEISDLLSTPDRLAAQVRSTIDLVSEAFTDSDSILAGLFDDNAGYPVLIADTPSRRQQRNNDRALRALVRRVAVANLARVQTDADHASYQDALDARDTVLSRIDDEVEQAVDDDAIAVLLALRARTAKAIPASGATLPYLITYTPPATVPSLVLAQRLYGDASRADEIVARNSIRHPAFITGGRAIEVLSDG